MSAVNRSLVIRNGMVLLSDGKFARCDVRLAEEKVEAFGHDLPADGVLDTQGAYVLPGLVDLHTHGIGRESLESAVLDGYAALEAAHGATTFLPTLFGPPSASVGHMNRHLRTSLGLRLPPTAGARVGGFRLESPYLAQTGAGLKRDLVPITARTTAALLAAGGGYIKIWDVSPELPGAAALIRRLSSTGIICSLAHTHATIEEARAAVDAGARLVTHLFDAFALPVMTEPGAYPAGLVDYLLVEDRLTCEIIADGTHVHPLLVEKALRCKTPERLAWVTDSNFGAGLPPGEYDAPKWGRIAISGPNGGARLVERDMNLAGSALTPIDGLRNAVRLFGRDLAVASRLCSATPARLLGLNCGEIAIGRDADLIILDAGLELLCTIVGGAVVYRRPSVAASL